jgi:hypothetical protein
MSQIKLTSQLKKVPFFYSKSKMIAKWILEGYDRSEISQNLIHHNKIQIESITRRQEVTNHLYQRVSVLDQFLLKAFLEMDMVTSKFILLYSVAKQDPLFDDFLSEVYRNAVLGEKKYISMDDFDLFFISKRESNLIVNKWSTTTIELLGKAYRKMLIDSNLGVRKLKNIYVRKIFIHPEIMKYIEAIGDYKYLQSILGEK